MKKKISIILIALLAVVLICAILLYRKPVTPFDKIETAMIDKVILYYPGDQENIFESETDIACVLEILQSMRLKRSALLQKDGFAMQVDLQYHNGEVQHITISSTDIWVDGKCYSCDRDYCEDFHILL